MRGRKEEDFDCYPVVCSGLRKDKGVSVKRFPLIVGLATVSVACLSIAAAADSGFNSVSPKVFDPLQTELVNASWISGIGCPTASKTATFDSQGNPIPGPPYTDPACSTGDTRDTHNEGLLMAKTGPTPNDAAAVAVLDGVQGTVLTELGYDIRKPGVSVDLRGSHCGAGAPRFNITLQDGSSYFLGCNSPPAPVQQAGTGWLRLRWGGTFPLLAFNATTFALESIAGKTVKSIAIVFDEGQDTGPDNFGLAVLDNIEVNGQLVGRGGRASN